MHTTTMSVTDDTFDAEVLASEQTVLVEFWAAWCGPCRALSPILEQLGIDHSDTLKVVRINADENMLTAAKYHAMSLPTTKVFQNGEVVKTIIGAKPRPALEADLAAFLP